MLSKIDKEKGIHFLKLETGEDILPSLIQYCKENNIQSGTVQGIGAVEKAVVGFFDLKSNEYKRKELDFNAELLNCAGNISKKADTGEYVVHCHILLGDSSFGVHGGHLFDGTIISVTGEFVIIESSLDIRRSLDKRFQLSLLNLS
ncbi:MAG: PPC domain-containing DNA-binding protein [Candidatus Heimdallarchaeaceae archaeon]